MTHARIKPAVVGLFALLAVVLPFLTGNVYYLHVATLISATDTIVFDSQLTNGVEASLDAKITDQWHLLANATAQEAVVTAAPQALTTVGKSVDYLGRVDARAAAL